MSKLTEFDELLGELRAASQLTQKIRNLEAHLGPEVCLVPKQLAVLLQYSERTLLQMREDGTGPGYLQGGVGVPAGVPRPKRRKNADGEEPEKKRGTNQHIRYPLREIRAWMDKAVIHNVHEAAIRKGQARGFIDSFADLVEEIPFYLDEEGRIEKPAELGTLRELLERADDIEWLPVGRAATQPWSDADAHRAFGEPVRRFLTNARDHVDSAIERTAMQKASREPSRSAPTDTL
jgi:hypothetical protein